MSSANKDKNEDKNEDENEIAIKIATDIFISWKKCKDNHIFLDKINNKYIKYDKNLILEPNTLLYSFGEIKQKTLYIDSCDNLTLNIKEKINHIVIINSSNINIIISKGLISGIDILHSSNIKLKIKNIKIFLSEFIDCKNCMYIYDINNNMNDMNGMKIITHDCYNFIFIKLLDNTNIEKIETNTSLFLSSITYIIQNNSIKYSDYNSDNNYN